MKRNEWYCMFCVWINWRARAYILFSSNIRRKLNESQKHYGSFFLYLSLCRVPFSFCAFSVVLDRKLFIIIIICFCLDFLRGLCLRFFSSVHFFLMLFVCLAFRLLAAHFVLDSSYYMRLPGTFVRAQCELWNWKK